MLVIWALQNIKLRNSEFYISELQITHAFNIS